MASTAWFKVYHADGAAVTFERSGRIMCKENGARWCEHIEGIIMRNEDAEYLWEAVVEESEEFDREYMLDVPMIPSVGVYETMRLVPVRIGKSTVPNALEVWFSVSLGLPPGSAPDPRTMADLLGYLNPGEGTKIIRQMIFEWFNTVLPDLLEKECLSKSHSFPQQMAWETAMKNPAKRISEFYCLMSSGMCTSCKRGDSLAGNWSEFVPDKENAGRRF